MEFFNKNYKYAPAPFWAINDKLNKEETKEQIKDIINHNCSGAFFHSRHGLITEYLSNEWFDNIKASIEEAKKNNGYVWLYDEDLFPSGNCGGKIAGQKDEYRASFLKFEFVPIGDKPLEIDATFKCAYLLKGRSINKDTYDIGEFIYTFQNEIEDFKIISLEEAEENTDCERIIVRQFYAPKTPWWSGESYVNLLNPKVTEEFIKSTHEKYKKEIGNEFGKTVPGIFTDEPQLSTGYNVLAWWEGLPAKYYNDHKRDFWFDLPYMIFDHENAISVRLNISRTILDQFINSYDKKVYEWCEENNLLFTGHYSAEDYYREQIRYHYGSIMTHYKYSHIPGVDHLCKQVNGIKNNPKYNYNSILTVKQVSSAAHQYNRNQVMVELWGVTGHTTNLSELKWIGDINMVLGATFLVPHLSLYSIRGRRKRDFPPVFNYQQSYWNDFKYLLNYFKNLSNIVSQGKPNADILILSTVESAVAIRKLGFIPQKLKNIFSDPLIHKNIPYNLNSDDYYVVDGLEEILRNTCDSVASMGFDFDLGDEAYIEEMGNVKGNIFSLGSMNYKLIIVPEGITFRPSTCEKLKEFADNGGKVLILGKGAKLVDGKENPISIYNLIKNPNVFHCPYSNNQIRENISKIYTSHYSLKSNFGEYVKDTFVLNKITDSGEIFFIANSNCDFEKDYIFETKKYNNLYVIDCNEEKIYKSKGNIHLGKYESIVLYATNEILTEDTKESIPKNFTNKTVYYPKDYSLSDDNILVSDNVSYSFDNGKTWSEITKDYIARKKTANHFNTSNALYWQNWVCKAKGEFDDLGGNVIIKYFFEANKDCDCRVAFENLNKGEAYLNGNKLDFKNNIWKFDRYFKTAPIKVSKGTNVIEHKFFFNYESDIEPIYIYGNFGVNILNKNMGQIDTLPNSIEKGSIINQGLAFYTGSINYSFTVDINSDNPYLKIINPISSLYKVYINDKLVKTDWFGENILSLKNYCHIGKNSIIIELVTSLQNAFGPIHDKAGAENYWNHTEAFENTNFTLNEYTLYDYGLGGIEILSL